MPRRAAGRSPEQQDAAGQGGGGAGIAFFSISGGFVEMFVGRSAAGWGSVLTGHGKAPCIVFIDEIDTIK
ncbi:MAG: AAA family ATPase [Merdibacter sp.]